MNKKDFYYIIVESFIPNDLNGRHGVIHIRPIAGQTPFNPEMFVECSKELSENYPVGTKFRIKAKLISRQGGTPFIYSHYSWSYEVLKN